MLKPGDRGWIERELEQSLRRVAAPGELWDRVHRAEHPRARSSSRFVAWATVPVLMVAALLGTHTRNNSAVQFRSSDPVEVRAWVRANAGIDVPLHDGNLAGARLLGPGAAVIAYRVQGRDLSLVVSSRRAVPPKGASISWKTGGQAYLLACSEPQYLKSCTLCHVGG